jgi:hypothetical protein
MSSIVSVRKVQRAVLWAALWTAVQAHAAWSLVEGAQTQAPLAPGVPKGSDVVFSVRSLRPEAIDVAKSFSATRIEWSYAIDPEFIKTARKEVGWFGGAMNALTKLPTEAGASKDFDGKTIVPPRMKAWDVQWNTTTHPDTQAALRSRAKRYMEVGADSIQIDDPLLQYFAGYALHGDFNDSTVAGFPAYLKRADPAEVQKAGLAGFQGDYRELLRKRFGIQSAKDYSRQWAKLPTRELWLDYLKQSVADHFAGLREYLKSVHGSAVPLSMNLSFLDRPSEENRNFFLTPYADYSMAETLSDDVLEMQLRVITARSLGLGFVPSPKAPKDAPANRWAIASFYAMGGNPLVPWDVFVGNDDQGKAARYFGTPADYADLYQFVRRRAALFDGYEQTPVVGIVVPVDRYAEDATLALVRRLNQRRIPFAFVPVGGKHRKIGVDVARLEHFKLLVTPNPEPDFARDQWGELHRKPLSMIHASRLADSMVDELVPLVVGGGTERLQWYPRARIDGKTARLSVHLVDQARSAPGPGDCRRRVVLRRSALGNFNVDKVSWHSPTRDSALELTREGGELAVTIPECVMWGVVSYDLK